MGQNLGKIIDSKADKRKTLAASPIAEKLSIVEDLLAAKRTLAERGK